MTKFEEKLKDIIDTCIVAYEGYLGIPKNEEGVIQEYAKELLETLNNEKGEPK